MCLGVCLYGIEGRKGWYGTHFVSEFFGAHMTYRMYRTKFLTLLTGPHETVVGNTSCVSRCGGPEPESEGEYAGDEESREQHQKFRRTCER